jgi:hypothetical protein
MLETMQIQPISIGEQNPSCCDRKDTIGAKPVSKSNNMMSARLLEKAASRSLQYARQDVADPCAVTEAIVPADAAFDLPAVRRHASSAENGGDLSVDVHHLRAHRHNWQVQK